jgi:phosphatidylglycerophosphate synthase
MQAVLAIPGRETVRDCGPEVLMQKVAGVPLLIRVIATAARAGVDSVLVIWPDDLDVAILESLDTSKILSKVQIVPFVWPGTFDPRTSQWGAIAAHLADKFLWLPWNWVTTKAALGRLSPTPVLPANWTSPILVEKGAVLSQAGFRKGPSQRGKGVAITSRAAVREAERYLVRTSGKATDGIYSSFNRRLCRPFVRLLSYTPVTPNVVTLAGLLIAIAGAFLFARGSYVYYVAGALLFFVSGLVDEMDGMLARIKFRESAFGTWFEGFVDNVTYLATFAGITAGLHHQYGQWPLKFGIALIAGCILSVIVIAVQRKLSTAHDRPHEYAGKMNQLLEADSGNPISRGARLVGHFVRKGILIHYLLLFTLVGALPLFLWLAAIGSNLTWICALYFTFRFFLNPSLETEGDNLQKAA